MAFRDFVTIPIVLVLSVQTMLGIDTPKCFLSGTVSNAPRNGLVVKLRTTRQNASSTFDGYLAKIASDGTFRFEGIAPGSYILSAEAPGFLPVEYGATKLAAPGTPITLAGGERAKNMDLTLVPKTVVCGRVTDTNGKPIVNKAVSAHLKQAGSTALISIRNGYVQTDVNGEFRFPDLPPGQYFISALFSTWFPSAKSFNEAQLVDVGASSDTACKTDIVVDESGYYTFDIRGEVVAPAKPYRGALFLSLLETNCSGAVWPTPFRTQLKPGDKFDLSGMRTKRYKLVLTAADNLNLGTDEWQPEPWRGGWPLDINVLAAQDVFCKRRK